jgi:ABC-type branched-subunit amino acid transport system ATPase component
MPGSQSCWSRTTLVLMTVAETVHVLNFGEIIARGNMAAIQQNAGVREVYLGM